MWHTKYYNKDENGNEQFRTFDIDHGLFKATTYFKLGSQKDFSKLSMVFDSINWAANPFAFATFPYHWRQGSVLSTNPWNSGTNRVAIRHVGATNVGFLDGHVESWDKIKTFNKGIFWNGNKIPVWIGRGMSEKYAGFGQ